MADYRTTPTKENGGTRRISGNQTDEVNALLEQERKGGEGLDTPEAADYAEKGLDRVIAARKRFDEMNKILTSGAIKDLSLEEKEAFVAEYRQLKAENSFAKGGKACRGRKAMGSAEKR